LYRQAELKTLEDLTQKQPMERAAQLKDLDYIDLGQQGNIGTISNSCGLAMATNDVLIREGGKPVNAMDIGQGDDESLNDFLEALDLHADDKRVKVILMNCFGGNVSMEGVMRMAFKAYNRGLTKPVVFRFGGFEKEEARQSYKEIGDKYPLLHIFEDMDEAIQKTIDLAM